MTTHLSRPRAAVSADPAHRVGAVALARLAVRYAPASRFGARS